MTTDWTPHVAAQAMLEIFPQLGRMFAMRIRESGEEEATLMQLRTIMRLREQPITTSELAKQRKVSLQSASVLVQGLVEKGWVTREPDPNDRRQSLLRVTPEGAARAEAAHEMFTGMVTEMLSDLTPEELHAAAVFLPALRRAVNAHMQTDILPEEQPHE